MAGPISLRPFRALCLVGMAVVSVQACGGRSDMEDYLLYGDEEVAGSPAAGGSPGTGASASTGGKKPGKGGTSTGASAPVGGDASEGGSVSAGGSGIAGTISSGGVGNQGGIAQGGTGPFIPVTCGGETCNALSQVCCATLGGMGCVAEEQECTGATLLCGTTADCTDDQVCCLQIIGETNATAQCKDACEGRGPGRERRLCSNDSECSPNRPFCRDTTFGVKVCTRF